MNTASGVSGHPEDTIHQGASNAGHAGGHDTAQAEVQPAKSAIIRGQSDQNEMDELNGHFSEYPIDNLNLKFDHLPLSKIALMPGQTPILTAGHQANRSR
jgi:hypothetical protein